MFNKILNSHQSFLIATHLGPDGDAIASLVAMGLVLKHFGKNVTYYCHHRVPEKFRFLSETELIKSDFNENDSVDALVFVDCGSPDRAGEKIAQFKNYKTKINIDHHKTNSLYGDVNVVISSESSCGNVIYKIAKELDVPITKPLAEALYCSLLTDTGRFSFSNTSTADFQMAKELLEYGADANAIALHVYFSKSSASLLLLKRALDTLEFVHDRKIASVVLTNADFENCGAKIEDSEEIVNYPRALEPVRVALFFKELKENEFKVSIRNKLTTLDISKVANEFGGGGHSQAAGCILKGDIQDIKKKIYDALIRVV